MKYNWTIDSLIDTSVYLNMRILREKNNEIKESLKYDLEYLNDIIEEKVNPVIFEMPKLLESYKYTKEELQKHSFLWEDIKIFNDSINGLFLKIPNLKQMSLSKKDILELTHDFYKTLDKFFYHNFLKYYRKRYDHIIFNNPKEDGSTFLGESILVSSLEEAYIAINRSNTIEDVFTTIHEYEHALSGSINPMHARGVNNLYCELDTQFMEMLAVNYLESIFNNGEAYISKAVNFESACIHSYFINEKINLIKEEEKIKNGFTNNKELKECAARLGLISEEVDDILYDDFLPYDYVISYLFAIELYDLYKLDKEKAFHHLRKIVLLDCKNELEYYNNLKRLNLIPNYHVREYTKEIRENIKKLNRTI